MTYNVVIIYKFNTVKVSFLFIRFDR